MKYIYGLYVFVLLGRIAHGVDITFYKDIHYRGESVTVAVYDQFVCNEVPHHFRDQVSSVKVPNGGIRVYDEHGCNGDSIMVDNAVTKCPGSDLSSDTSGSCNHPSRHSWNDVPKSFRFYGETGSPTSVTFSVLETAVDTTWNKGSSVTYCGETNDCSRALTLQVTKATTVTQGKEFAHEMSTTHGWSNSITEAVTREISGGGSAAVSFLIFEVGGSAGYSEARTTEKTSEKSFEVTSTRGTTLTYSTSEETTLGREEQIQCNGKPGSGFYIEYRTNALVVTGNSCVGARCQKVQLRMLPYNHNGVMTADYRCATVHPDRGDGNGNAQKQNGACRTFDQACDDQNGCCDTGLTCYKHNPTWKEGKCYNKNAL